MRRHGALIQALLGDDPTAEEIRESTALARVNGWVSGHGTKAEMLSESKALGFSESAWKELRLVLGRRAPAVAR